MQANDQVKTKTRRADHQIKTKTRRLSLTPRAKPYNNSIGPCRLLGYIRRSGAAGSWVVDVEVERTVSGWSKRRQKMLGLADDMAEANGADILAYQEAIAAASAWQPKQQKGGKSGAFTVRQAVEQHRDYGGKRGDKAERNKERAYNSLRYHVLREDADDTPREGAPGLGEVALADLTTEMLKNWREGMIRNDLKATDEKAYIASRVSAERTWSNFRSCLEQAYKRGSNGIKSADAWRNVESLGKDGNRREVHFSMEEALTYIEAARANGDDAAADVFEAYMQTGARPGGELASLTVDAFNARLHRLSIPKRGEQVISKTGKREITLDDEGVAFFERISAGRPKTAPLLLSPDGERWDMKQRQRYFKDVLARAGAPEGTVPYSFRHSIISRWVETGESLKLIAEMCGTSVGQIEKTYAKFLPDVRRAMVQATRPKLRLVTSESLKTAA